MALDKIYSTDIVPVSERSRVMNDILKHSGKHEIILNLQTAYYQMVECHSFFEL